MMLLTAVPAVSLSTELVGSPQADKVNPDVLTLTITAAADQKQLVCLLVKTEELIHPRRRPSNRSRKSGLNQDLRSSSTAALSVLLHCCISIQMWPITAAQLYQICYFVLNL